MIWCKLYQGERRSNNIPRATFTPEEVAGLTINFYLRNYIEGLFLSSAVYASPDTTMAGLIEICRLLRHKHRFNGYIHLKIIPGAAPELVDQAALLADRLSVNIELPYEASLKMLAPQKSRQSIFLPMRHIGDHFNGYALEKMKGGTRNIGYLNRLSPQALHLTVNAFLSEDRNSANHLHLFIRLCLRLGRDALLLRSNDAVLGLESISRRVDLEAHRLKGMLRFRILKDGLQYAPFAADHNVIGYLADHFRSRFTGTRWVLHDTGRKLALYWNGEKLEAADIDEAITAHVARFGELPAQELSPEEKYYQELWKGFHAAIAIPGRENSALQKRFMPRRYWRYLIEMKEINN
jgi:probable DNA metabolism protein